MKTVTLVSVVLVGGALIAAGAYQLGMRHPAALPAA